MSPVNGIWPNFGPATDASSARRANNDQATLDRMIEVSMKYDPDGVLQIGSFTRMGRLVGRRLTQAEHRRGADHRVDGRPSPTMGRSAASRLP